MPRHFLFILFAPSVASLPAQSRRPNIDIRLAADLGCADTGIFGSTGATTETHR